MPTSTNSHSDLPRRAFLRKAGSLVALPLLYSLPARLVAEAAPLAPLATTANGNPLRLAFIYHPNGVIMDNWSPSGQSLGSLPHSLQPLQTMKDSLTVVSGLKHDKAFGNGDGAGDHARATGTYLTGVQLKKTGGADIKAGKSIDQEIADKLAGVTPMSSLELSCSNVRSSGNCDSGYSCAYQFNMSWRSEDTPNTPEVNPRSAFARLFGGATSEERRRMEAMWGRRQSVLDSVTHDARKLYRDVSVSERGKLEAYLESVRAVEKRISSVNEQARLPSDVQAPDGIPASYEEYLDTMYEIMALAFETDSTRVITFLQAHDGSGRKFPELGIHDGHHTLSHHEGEVEKIEMLKQIDRFYVEAYARFIQRLSETREGQRGSLLDSCLVVYGSGISDGNRHRHDNLPVMIAGKGGGLLRGNQHKTYKDEPMCNLYMDLAESMGAPLKRFGDSTATLKLV